MWNWKRIASVAVLIGGGAVCALVPGAQGAAPLLITAGVSLALGIAAPPVGGKGK